jgi:hypothetical protein
MLKAYFRDNLTCVEMHTATMKGINGWTYAYIVGTRFGSLVQGRRRRQRVGQKPALRSPAFTETPREYPMKHFLPLTLALLAGCGGYRQNPQPTKSELPNNVGYGGPARRMTAPRVTFVGDSVMASWLTPAVLAANPTWTAQTSANGIQETTQDILARFPAALALKPAIIVIEAGTWSMAPSDEPSWMCNYGADDPIGPGLDNPCDDIGSMVSDAEVAGVYAIVCTIPPWGLGPTATQIDASDPPAANYTREDNVGSFNFALRDIEYPANFVPVGFADFYGYLNGTSNDPNPWWEFESEDDVDYLYDPAYTTDGVTPTPAAQLQMVAMIQALIAKSDTHGENQ